MASIPEACASCPFRDDNNEEFLKKINALRLRHNLEPLDDPDEAEDADDHVRILDAIDNVRYRIEEECERDPDFACHCSVYDENMNVRPVSDHRQCPGATKYHLQCWANRTGYNPRKKHGKKKAGKAG